MKLTDIRSKLAGLPLLRSLPDHMQERTAMAFFWVSEASRAEPGATLFKEGDHDANTGCLLLEGSVQVAKDGSPPIEVSGPTILGEMKQLTPEQSRTATVTVAEQALMLRFLWHDFVAVSLDLFSRKEQMALKEAILRSAGQRFEQLFDQVLDEALTKEHQDEDVEL